MHFYNKWIKRSDNSANMISTTIITSIFIWQSFAGTSITKWLILSQFASTQLDVFYFLLNSKFKWLEIGSLMTSITPRLFQTLTATAPTIYLIMNFRVFYDNWPRNGRYRLNCLILSFAIELLFDISIYLRLQMFIVLILRLLMCILRLNDPSFRFHLFDFPEEKSKLSTNNHK